MILKTALRSARPLECKAAVLQDDDPPWNGTPAARAWHLPVNPVNSFTSSVNSFTPPSPPWQRAARCAPPRPRKSIRIVAAGACGGARRSGPRARQFDFASRRFQLGLISPGLKQPTPPVNRFGTNRDPTISQRLPDDSRILIVGTNSYL